MKKKLYLLIVMTTLCCLNIMAGNTTIISKEDAWDSVKLSILKDSLKLKEVYLMDNVVKANSVIKTVNKDFVSPNYDAWFFFIDDMPLNSWEHPCRYLFVNIEDGSINTFHMSLPPDLRNMTCLERRIMENVKMDCFRDASAVPIIKSQKSVMPNIHNYAIIISGGINNNYNYERYWNDCSFIYSTLRNKYAYPKDNIFVLMSDGTNPGADLRMNDGSTISSPLDLDGDGDNDITYAATRSNVTSVFNSLSNILTSKDTLLIFTMDHGGQSVLGDSISCLYLWDNDILFDYELAFELGKVHPAVVNICMGQCHSGGFINDLRGTHHVIATACKYEETSYSLSNYEYDEFVYYWISALAKKTPYGTTVNADTNGDGVVSMSEAFQYALVQDSQPESPQYCSVPYTYGDSLCAGHIVNLSYVGNQIMCGTEIYGITGIPNGYSVTWEFGDSLQVSNSIIQSGYPSQNQCTVNINNNESIDNSLIATVLDSNQVVTRLSKGIMTGSSFEGTYSQQGAYYHYHNYPSISETIFEELDIIRVNPGCLITLHSPNFKYMTIRRTGQTLSWQYDGNETITLKMPHSNSGVSTLLVSGMGAGSCNDFSFMVEAYSGSIPSAGQLMVMSNSGSIMIRLNTTDQSNAYVEICNGMTRDIVFKGKLTESEIPTSGWKRGVYIVRVSSGDDVYSRKIII